MLCLHGVLRRGSLRTTGSIRAESLRRHHYHANRILPIVVYAQSPEYIRAYVQHILIGKFDRMQALNSEH